MQSWHPSHDPPQTLSPRRRRPRREARWGRQRRGGWCRRWGWPASQCRRTHEGPEPRSGNLGRLGLRSGGARSTIGRGSHGWRGSMGLHPSQLCACLFHSRSLFGALSLPSITLSDRWSVLCNVYIELMCMKYYEWIFACFCALERKGCSIKAESVTDWLFPFLKCRFCFVVVIHALVSNLPAVFAYVNHAYAFICLYSHLTFSFFTYAYVWKWFF